MYRTPLTTVLILLALAGHAFAGSGQFSLGLSSSGMILSADDPYDNDTFYGGALLGTYAIADNMGVRGLMYATEHDDVSELDNNGLEAHFLFGSHLLREGFRYYGLAGFFSETWEAGSEEEDFSGLTLGFGIGYTWKKVALDWWGAWRQPGDYQDLVDEISSEIDVSAASGALALSYRF